ncbi:hypothetical protein ACOXXX_14635 [Thalassococcus sp. BH17M4-6]|uniref:hypothetical protein n=1 Tax=Thalassococcus sp. BH17M4-6 TaxID=3413148 RepID=UPI003BDE0BD6
MPLDFNILGQGIYSPRQAARLIGGKPQDVLRWTRGSGSSEPLWNAYYQALEDATELSFSDVVELRVVKSFRDAGISLQAIRYAISFAQRQYGVERPLSTLRFKTDGREILHEALELDGQMVSLSKKRPGQKVFTEIIKQSLSGLEYEDGNAARWRPAQAKHVVIDPGRQFGSPMVDEFGISTAVLFDEFEEFKDMAYLSRIYEIPNSVILDAVRYEQNLDKTGAYG